MNNYIKEIKAVLILGLIFSLLIALPNLCSLLISNINTNVVFLILLIHICLIIVFYILSKRLKNKLFSKILKILVFPIDILYLLLTFIIPFGIILLHVFFYFAISNSIPLIIISSFNFFFSDLITKQTLLYLLISITTFIMVILNYQIRNIVHNLSPARIKHSKKMKPFEIEKISTYLLSENNIRFLIYAIYVVILIFSNFSLFQLQENSFTINAKPILQSFVTFIAFDRAVSLMKNLNFKPSDFLNMFFKSIINKLADINKNSKDY